MRSALPFSTLGTGYPLAFFLRYCKVCQITPFSSPSSELSYLELSFPLDSLG
jgi:hypothetical protein